MVLADDELSEAEKQVVRAAVTGDSIDLALGKAEPADRIAGELWDGMPRLRAEVLVELLTGARGSARAVRVTNAHIVGACDLELATVVCPVVLLSCHFDEPINLRQAQAATIRFAGCHVPSIRADQLRTHGSLEFLFTTSGAVNLTGAHVGGYLIFSGASLTNPDDIALAADLLTVDLAMLCRDGFTTSGAVRLSGAHLGELSFSSATLRNPRGVALNAAGLMVDGSVMCRDGFVADGEVTLLGARIGADLVFSTASLSNPDGHALTADRLTVGQNMWCDDGFTAEGEIRLSAAHIGGQLNFTGATLTNPGGNALVAEGLVVDQDLFCRAGFAAHGAVSLIGAKIAWGLHFDDARLTNPGGLALDLEDAQVTSLSLLPAAPPDGVVDLTNARVRSFYDYAGSWPDVLWLRGFTYERLENDPDGDAVRVAYRLAWLMHHRDGYVPGLFDQLAAVYRRSGRVEAARRVSIAKLRRRREVLSSWGKAWNWLLQVTVGYGYRPWLAGVWLLALLVVGSVVFAVAYPTHIFPAVASPPTFQPVVYTLDVLVPIVDLNQKRSWYPTGAAQLCAWVLTGAGWVLTTAVVAGVTNTFKRE